MEEIWRPVNGYEGRYEVSNYGRVKSLQRTIYRKDSDKVHYTQKEKILKPTLTNYGYLRINLCNGVSYKSKFVHVLVAEAFIPNPNNYPIINHKDENKQNNIPENLEWCSYQYNCLYGTRLERWKESMRKNKIKKEQ